MKVYQIICTLKKGILKEMVFETIAVSPEILQDDKAEVEEMINSCTSESEYEKGRVQAPSYSYFALKSGRYCFCMSRSMDDEGGRICHALIFDEAGEFYPVQLVESPIFNQNTDGIPKGTALPVLSDVPLGNMVTIESVSAFIKERLNQGFSEMLNCAVDYKRKGLHISVIDTEENMILWAAAVQMSFPVGLSYMVSFSTMDVNNSTCCMMHCYSSEYYGVIEDRRDSYIFDYKNGVRGKPEQMLKFTRVVEVGYSVSRRTLEAFHKFLTQFDYKSLDCEIDDCYNLFLLAALKQTNALDSGGIRSAFDFAVKYGGQDILEDLFQMLEPSMDGIVRAVDFEGAESLTEFLFKTALNSSRLLVFNRAIQFFFSMLDHLIFDYKIQDADGVINIFFNAVEMCGEKSQRLYRYCVSEDHIVYLAAVLGEKPGVSRAEVCMKMVIQSLIELGSSWDQAMHIKEMPVLLDLCVQNIGDSPGNIGSVLDTAAANSEYFARVSMIFYNRIGSREIMEGLIEKVASLLETIDEERALEIRRQIHKLEGGKLLIDEFSRRLYRAEDKTSFFNEYWSKVFDKMKSYEKQFFSSAAAQYVGYLDKKTGYNESLRLLKGLIQGSYDLDDKAVSSLIKVFERQADIAPSDEIRDMIPEIKKIKKARSIDTFPDITKIVDYALWLENTGGRGISLDESIGDMSSIEGLDDQKFEQYVRWCLPHIIKLAKSAEDHKKIVHSLGGCEDEGLFFKNYINMLGQVLSSSRYEGINLFISFCVYYFFYLEPRYRILEEGELIEHINNLLLEVIKEQPGSVLKEIDRGIRSEFENRRLSLPVLWNRLYNEVSDSRDKSLMDNIKGFFKKRDKQG